jgi:branched-chain amino acid:cation transporter, LIVCS family
MKRSAILTVGIALFAMFFGAGNVVFPLDLGRVVGDHVWYALLGIFLSAAVMPVLGILGSALFEGDYQAFFYRIGQIPGYILMLLCMLLIGPFGAIPRTITLAHKGFAQYFPWIPLPLFIVVALCLILYFTARENKIIDSIGTVLGPIKIVLLASVVIAGFFIPPHMNHTTYSALQCVVMGFQEGYKPMDLLGAMFFGKLILMNMASAAYVSRRQLYVDVFKAGLIGALLLAVAYVGFMVVGALHGAAFSGVNSAQLIFALSDYVLGSFGVLASFAVAMACLVTAIALTAVFADFISNVIFSKRVSYKQALVASVIVTGSFALLDFNGIMEFLWPILMLCYPAVIVLTIVNIAYKLYDVRLVKTPFYITLAISFAKFFHLF